MSLAAGDEAGLSDIGLPKSDFALDLEAELGWHRQAIHGRNHGADHRSADGEGLDVLMAAINLWPGWQLTRWLTAYVGGGGGLGYAFALGQSEPSWFAQAGGGLRANLTPALSFDVGARAGWMGEATLRGYELRYDDVGPVFGVRWEFK